MVSRSVGQSVGWRGVGRHRAESDGDGGQTEVFTSL